MDTRQSTLTFLFTDIEGSTRMWEKHPKAMRGALSRHDSILRTAIGVHCGEIFKTAGDAFYAAFSSTGAAVRAAIAAQVQLSQERWEETGPLHVRMAVHTGTVESRDGDFFGRPLNRVARLLGLAHGEQVLLSEVAYGFAVEELASEVTFLLLGHARLKGIEEAGRVYQLLHPKLRSNFPPLPDEVGPTNLPTDVSRFLGREQEISELKMLSGKSRLVTVTGSGGTGKTRLALRVGGMVREQFRDGVWLVELAGVRETRAVASEIASVMGVREAPGEGVETGLARGLAERDALLILDNCEHVVSTVADLVTRLLKECPSLRIMATSREVLGIPGEQTFRVPSLSMPAEDDRSLESLGGFESVRLFVDRAAAVSPQFALTAANASAVAQVCRELDGMPLALELAAARVRALPVEKLAQRLGDRFRLLTAGSRGNDPRQQTLRGLIDWSYDLLPSGEQTLLRLLSAFAGGWDLEAVEAVVPGANASFEPWDMLDGIQSLVDKSLVIYDEPKGRYRLMETVRQYAQERAIEASEFEALREAHARWAVQRADELSRGLSGSHQVEIADSLEADHDNLRNAHVFLMQARNVDSAQRLVGALAPFWVARSYLTEGVTRCLESLSLGLGPERLKALLGTGRLLLLHADPSAVTIYEEALARARESGELGDEAEANHGLANWYFYAKDHLRSEAHYRAALEIWLGMGEKAGVASCTHSLGNLALRREGYDEARSLFQDALTIRRSLGDVRGVTMTTGAMSQLALARGEFDEAERLNREVARSVSDLRARWTLALCLSALFTIDLSRKKLESAARLAGARSRVREMTGFPLPAAERDGEQAVQSELREQVGGETYDRAYAEGRSLSWEGALALVLDERP